MTCDICNSENNFRLRCVGNGVWACCVSEPKKLEGTVISKKIRLGSIKVSEAQLGELNRRVRLPDKKPGGGYYLGRRMENGKIAFKWPDYA